MLRAMAEQLLGSPAVAVGLMAARSRPVGVERVPLERALGRILAESVRADRDSPAVDVSAMDGFAVRSAEAAAGDLAIAGDVRIGQEPRSLPPGAALRIVTGAPLPPGADVVVRREDADERGGRVSFLRAGAGLGLGVNVRRRGENTKMGAEVLAAGVEITAPVAAAMAAFGCANPVVRRRVRVGILVTGDEVLGVESAPTPYQLRDSNGYSVMSVVSRRAWAEVSRAPTALDDPHELRAAMLKILADADMLIVTGGVSMGERDFVPQVVRDLGAEVMFHKVTQRPGKPVFGAVMADGRPVFGLPGNPLSVMVTSRRMVVPVLERLAGVESAMPPLQVRIDNPDGRQLDMWWHRFVRISEPGWASLLGVSSSGDVVGPARSDGFVEVPPGMTGEGPWSFFPWA